MSKPVHRNLAKYTFCKERFNQGKQLDTKKAPPGTWATDMTKTDRTGYTDVFMFHASVYVLADTYAIEELQEFCLRRIRISLLYVTPNSELLEAFHDLILYVLENTKASDGFRKLLLHFCIAHIGWIKSSGFLQRMREELPDFLADLTVEIPLNLWSCMGKAR
ncbi:hypothetical protein CKAH01_02940 [Colletotrichum kahawae]|uniref:Uncharacterized protein n=1 Tax=Colletotrichum kahawae TaxID=34407 RepID=A0AAD9YWH1_COLKA|nr:hypothetical protein CKAH01_02940 [Colletotrichum kahawae]